MDWQIIRRERLVMSKSNWLKIAAIATGALIIMPKKSSYKDNRGNLALPRGIRNNNPGNLILTNIQWRGKVPNNQNTDGHFEQFIHLPYGLRAMIKDIFNDINKGKDTLLTLIPDYAPEYENDTTNYINTISIWTGITPTTLLTKQKEQTRSLIKAMARLENGGEYITNNDFNQAWSLL